MITVHKFRHTIHRSAFKPRERWNDANIDFLRGSKVVHGWDPGSTSRRKVRPRVRIGIRVSREKFMKWKYFVFIYHKGKAHAYDIKLQK